MSLVLTRKVGEAVIIEGPAGLEARRLYIVAIEGNTVRLAIDAPPEVKITREELLPPEARRRWLEDRGGRQWAAAGLVTALALMKLELMSILGR